MPRCIQSTSPTGGVEAEGRRGENEEGRSSWRPSSKAQDRQLSKSSWMRREELPGPESRARTEIRLREWGERRVEAGVRRQPSSIVLGTMAPARQWKEQSPWRQCTGQREGSGGARHRRKREHNDRCRPCVHPDERQSGQRALRETREQKPWRVSSPQGSWHSTASWVTPQPQRVQ